MLITAFDYETEFDEIKSVRTLGNRGYAQALSKRGVYMLSGYNPEMGRVAGNPKDFPWEKIKGGWLVAHNMGFDHAILREQVSLGVAPEWSLDMPTFCTADMSVYFQIARTLNGAVKAVFGEDLDKGIRNWMKGKTWQDAIDQGKSEELLEYAKDDAYWCYKLFEHLRPLYPMREVRISEHTRNMGYKGLPFDYETAQELYSELSFKRFDALELLAYTKRRDEKYRQNYKPSSKRGLASECKLHGIPAPKSTAQNDPDFIAWEKEYGDKYPFVRAFSDYGNINMVAKRLKAMMDRCVENPDGSKVMSYGMKYGGADTTLRFSGDTGYNVQNMPRTEKWGVNQRHLIKAPEGKTFVIADYNAIEPYLLALVLEDQETIDLLKEGYNPYEASARRTMGYDEDEPLKDHDPDFYLLAKIRVLQLCYGSGWFKFYETVRDYGRLDFLEIDPNKQELLDFGKYIKKYAKDRLAEWKDLDDATKKHWVNAWLQVTDFRKSNPLLTKKWRSLEKEFQGAVGKDVSYDLLNGEQIHYFSVRKERVPNIWYSCHTRRGEPRRTAFYGAKLLENIIQREARSVFSNGLLNLMDAEYDVVMHVHDEVVVLVDEDTAEESAKDIVTKLTEPPSWIGDKLPIRAEYEISKTYKK